MARGLKKKPIRYYSAKRRAVYAKGDSVDHLTLFTLYNWTCCICSEPINRHLRIPHFMAATVEHKIPISKGGTHTWDNVAPAHYLCNANKADAIINT